MIVAKANKLILFLENIVFHSCFWILKGLFPKNPSPRNFVWHIVIWHKRQSMPLMPARSAIESSVGCPVSWLIFNSLDSVFVFSNYTGVNLSLLQIHEILTPPKPTPLAPSFSSSFTSRATAEPGIWTVKNCWGNCQLCSSCYIVLLVARYFLCPVDVLFSYFLHISLGYFYP